MHPAHQPPSLDVLASIVGTHAQTLADHGDKLATLDDRADLVDLQLAVWKGQLRLLAGIAGLVGGGVGGLVSAMAGA